MLVEEIESLVFAPVHVVKDTHEHFLDNGVAQLLLRQDERNGHEPDEILFLVDVQGSGILEVLHGLLVEGIFPQIMNSLRMGLLQMGDEPLLLASQEALIEHGHLLLSNGNH